MNRVYDKPLPPGTTKYVPKSRMISPNNRSIIIGGSTYSELLRDNYRRVKGKWVKMSKEESKVYDIDSDDSSSSEYVDIDEFEYDEDRYAIFPF